MLCHLFVKYHQDPLTREFEKFEQSLEWIREMDCERLDKVVFTDLRPIYKKDKDGKVEEICP